MNQVLLDVVDLRILSHLQTNADVSNQDLALGAHVSAATCLRRVRRLVESGLIAKRVALLNPAALPAQLQVIAEVTLDKQGSEHAAAFEAIVVTHLSIQQCYRVSPGPDFVLIAISTDMAAWGQIISALFTQHRNVRNVKTYFVVRRIKFETAWPLPQLGLA